MIEPNLPIRPPLVGTVTLAVIGGVLAALAVFVIYWPVRENGFALDDWAILDVNNLVGMRDPALWRETLLRSPDNLSALFRPLAMFTFLLQLWAGQVEPQPFHIVNLAIHSANVFLLTLVAWRLLGESTYQGWGRAGMAALCGLIYGVHPVLTEPVIWISARADLLLTFFLILALFLDRTLAEAGWWRAVTAGVLFLAAMLCKESAVAFLLVLPMVHLAVHWLEPRAIGFGLLASVWGAHRKVYIALLTATAVYLAVRHVISAFGLPGAMLPDRSISPFSQHVLAVVASLAQHVWSALWPFQNIVPLRHKPLPINFTDVLPMAAASAAVIGVAIAAVCTNSPGRVAALLFLAFVGALVPVSNIVLIPAVASWDEIAIGSRYVTYPLAVACLAVPFVVRLANTSLVRHFQYSRTLLWVIVGAWLLASVANVRVTIPLWGNDILLNDWVVQQGGASFWRYGHLSAWYTQMGDYERARDTAEAALKLRDDRWAAWVWNNLGLAEFRLGRMEQARQAFQRALVLGTDEITSRLHLADLERRMGNLTLAAAILEEGLRRNRLSGRPHQLEAQLRYHLGLAYGALGRSDEAAAQLNAALALARNPEHRRIMEEALRSVPIK